MTPPFGHLKGIIGEMPEVNIHVAANKKEPLHLEMRSVSIPDKIEVELEETEKTRSYQVRVKNREREIASYNGEIIFDTNYHEVPVLKVRVTGNIRPAVEARPNALDFGRVSRQQIDRLKDQKRPMTRPVMVIVNKGDGLRLTNVRAVKGFFKTTSKTLQEGRMVQVVVEADVDKLKDGVNEDTLEIHTNQKGYEVFKVPVRLQVQ